MKRRYFTFLCLLPGVAFSCLVGCAVQNEKGNVRWENDERAIRRWFERWM